MHESAPRLNNVETLSPKAEEEKAPEVFDDLYFHEERWKRMAENHVDRPWWAKLFNQRKMEPEDFRYKEALRDNEDFDRRQHEEFEKWQEDLRIVVDNIKKKRELLDHPDSPENQEAEIRPLLLILGGGMKGPYSAGQVVGLNESGIPADTFDNIVGISAGAGAAAYYAAGPEQTKKRASLFYEECATRDFIDIWRGLGKVMNVKKLTMRYMGEGEKELDEDVVQSCRANLYFGVTKVPEGDDEPDAEFIDAKTAQPGLRPAMRASMSVPLVAGEIPLVNDVEYVDGAFDPLPVQKIIEKFNPTDILVLPNTPFDRLDAFELSHLEHMIAQIAKIGSYRFIGFPWPFGEISSH